MRQHPRYRSLGCVMCGIWHPRTRNQTGDPGSQCVIGARRKTRRRQICVVVGDAARKDKNHELQQSNKFTSVASQVFLKQCLVSWPKSIVPFRANYRQADLLQLPKGFETRDVSGATQQARGASEAARQCGKNFGGPRWRVNS